MVPLCSGLLYKNKQLRASQVALVVKNLPAHARDLRDKHSFSVWVRKIPWNKAWQPTLVFLPGESPWTEEPGRLQYMASQSRTQLKCLSMHATDNSDRALAEWPSPVSGWGLLSSSAAAAAFCRFPDLVEFCDLVTTRSIQVSYCYSTSHCWASSWPLVYRWLPSQDNTGP